MGDWQGVARDVGYMEQRSFELLTSADTMWAIQESLSLRPQDLGCNELGYKWEGVDRVATRVDSKGLEARQGRRRERNVHCMQIRLFLPEKV